MLVASHMLSIPFVAIVALRLRVLVGERGRAVRRALAGSGRGMPAQAAEAALLDCVIAGRSLDDAVERCGDAGLVMQALCGDGGPDALAELRRLGVRQPERWARVYLPDPVRDGA